MSENHTLDPVSAGAAVSVLRLGPAEAVEAAALEAACFTPGWSVEACLEAFVGLPAFRAYGLRDTDGVLVAYVTVYHTGDCLEILNFGT